MNIAESFADFLQNNLGIATLGQDLFIGNAPSSKKIPLDHIWWIKVTGGNPDTKLQSGEVMKTYFIEVSHRSRGYKTVYDDLHALEETLNCEDCVQLDGFTTIDVSAAVLTIDQDIDSEDRKVGLLQANIITYKECA